MLGRGGHGKNMNNLQKLLRQDHSDVYFNNEKLNEELNNRIDSMQRDMHKHDIQRGIEIRKLKRQIHEARAHQLSSHGETRHGESNIRPHTAAGYATKHVNSRPVSRKRAQSAWARTGSQSSNSETDISETPERCVTPASSESTLRNIKTVRKYKHIDTSCFKENNRFPEEWYVKCLPASDAAIHNARKKPRGKSAPARSHFGFLAKIREREQTEKKLQQFTKMNKKLVVDSKRNGERQKTGHDVVDGLNLVCEEPVKPILMSRRRLREISNVEHFVERGPSRNTEMRLNALQWNRQENTRICNKVRTFCKEIEELKAQEIQAVKAREEALRREAQERENTKPVNAAQEVNGQNNDGDKGT